MMMRTKVFAEDSREAMIKINREIGEDAVILSTKKVNGGIEIVVGHPKRETGALPDELPTDPKMRAFALAKAQAQAFVEKQVKSESPKKPSYDFSVGDDDTHLSFAPVTKPAIKSEKAMEFDRLLNETARQFDRRVTGGARPPTPSTQPKPAPKPAFSEIEAGRLAALEKSVNEISRCSARKC